MYKTDQRSGKTNKYLLIGFQWRLMIMIQGLAEIIAPPSGEPLKFEGFFLFLFFCFFSYYYMLEKKQQQKKPSAIIVIVIS